MNNRPIRHSLTGVYALTPAEAEVLALHVAGKSDVEIAALTARTVKTAKDRLRAAISKDRDRIAYEAMQVR